MRVLSRLAAVAVASIVGMAAAVSTADAKCTRLGFSVNDYGKDGPIKDAKELLDKYVADWAKGKGIAKYNTGKKTVNCELYLDVGFFDEHTCRAEATVCWGEGVETGSVEKTAEKPKKSTKKKAE